MFLSLHELQRLEGEENWKKTSWKKSFFLKIKVSVISSDFQCKNGNARFITAHLKKYLVHYLSDEGFKVPYVNLAFSF